METKQDLLLALLAVRLLGGRSVEAGAALLKPYKNQLQQATEQGFVTESKIKVPTTNKKGKQATKSVAVLDLADKGEQYLRQVADPATTAATNSGYLAGIRQSLEADRHQLRAEVQAASQVNPKTKPGDDGKAVKALEGLAKQITAVAGALQKLESDVVKQTNALSGKLEKLESDVTKHLGKASPAAESSGDSVVLNRIDHAFNALQQRLEQTLKALPAAPHSDQTPTSAPAAPTLPAALRAAYDRLCRFIEFKDGVVELPRLYHETRKAFPSLSVKEFQDELMALWQRRELELHVLNEVHLAAEPDKGIDHNNKLYYYARWKPS